MLILVVNPGSSSLKYSVRELGPDHRMRGGQEITGGEVEHIGDDGDLPDHAHAFQIVRGKVEEALGGVVVDAVGHRVVQGGAQFTRPVPITGEVLQNIERLSPLAPLHNPASVECIRAVGRAWPRIPQVAVFDTSFHRTLPEHVWRYALPDLLYREHGIRRYGFHGISVEYVGRRAADLLGAPWDEFDGVIAHLGNGCSATAVRGGRSVDTSMGFTPLEGLVMGTRAGDVDPGVLVFLQREGWGPAEIEAMLNRESGLTALAGHSDMRAVTAAAEDGDGRAQLALDVAAHRLAHYIGGYHVACGGARAVVLTGGIGENSAAFRAVLMRRLRPLGITLDQDANEAAVGQKTGMTISGPDSAIPVLVVPTDEAAAIAEATAAVVLSS